MLSKAVTSIELIAAAGEIEHQSLTGESETLILPPASLQGGQG